MKRICLSGEREVAIAREAFDKEADRRMQVLAGYVIAPQSASRQTLYEAAKEFVTAHEMWDDTGKDDGT